MKIDTNVINGYAEMSLEDKVKALENLEVGNDDSLLKQIEELKQVVSKANHEASTYKKELRAKQTDEELKQAEREEALNQMIAERDEYKAKLEEADKRDKIRGYAQSFRLQGYDEELANSTAKALYDGDTETFFKNQAKFNAEFEKNIRANIVKETPHPSKMGDGNGNDTVTKEQLDKMSYTERIQFKKNNPELYEKLTK